MRHGFGINGVSEVQDEKASCWLFEQGTEIAIAGCTELSVGVASMGGVAVASLWLGAVSHKTPGVMLILSVSRWV